MEQIALLLKSYAPDYSYAQRLVDSFQKHNHEGLKLHCVVPEEDLSLFMSLSGPHVALHSEGEVAGSHLVGRSVGGLRVGYANQEIVKLAFWETGLAANYFCVDSDAVFLRPFAAADFMRDSTTPYTVLVEDKDLLTEPTYYQQHWQGREEAIRRIMALVGLDDPVMRTCHGHQVFSARVLESFTREFLQPRGWSYADAIDASPYEFSWYAMWLQKSQVIPIHQREPFVKVYHDEEQHLSAILSGIGPDDLARAYLAVVVNSNYSRGQGVVSASGDKSAALAPYLSYGELSKVVNAKLHDTLKRRWG
jgi:hypothetical protein